MKKITAHRSNILRLIGWLMLATVVVMSLIKLPTTDLAVVHGDKWLHLLTYGGLAYWFFHIYLHHKNTVTIGMLLLGLILEASQGLTPYRYVEWLDLVMNMAGVGLAFVVFWWLKVRINWLSVHS